MGRAHPTFRTAGAGDSVQVGGDLTLDGAVLDVTAGAGFGPGLYKLFSYDGTLTTTGGSDGTWSQGSLTWADTNGNGPAPMNPVPGFAVFAGTPGTVTVSAADGAISATGLQFGVDGYTLTGDALTLLATVGNLHGQSEVRVGDGSGASAGWTAVIENGPAGTDGLDKTGAGTLVLTGANMYTGGTRIDPGTLQLGEGGASGSITGDVDDEGLLVFNRSDNVTFAGDITGGGGLRQAGAGSGTTIDAGKTLQVGDGGAAGSLIGEILDEGTLVFDRADTFSFDGLVGGSGSLTQAGAGTLILNGINTYTGGTLVQAGTLEVGDADHTSAAIAGDVVVAAGATLAGHGQIGGDVTNLSGNVRPGGSVDTLHVAGDYTQGAGGTLTIEIDPSSPASPGTGYSRLQVDGVVNLDGTLALALDGATYQVGTAYTFLTAAGGINGRFADLTAPPGLGDLLQSEFAYGAHGVSLTLNPTSALLATRYGGQLGPAALTIQSAFHTILGGLDQAAGPHDGAGDGRLGLWQRTLTAQGAYGARRHVLLGRTEGAGAAITPQLTLGLAASQAATTTDEGSFHAAVAAGSGRFNGTAVRASYHLDSAQLFVEPYVETSTVHTRLDAVAESGAGLLDLNFDALDATLRQNSGGVRFGADLDGGRVTPWMAVGGTRTFGDRAVDVTQHAGVVAQRRHDSGRRRRRRWKCPIRLIHQRGRARRPSRQCHGAPKH